MKVYYRLLLLAIVMGECIICSGQSQENRPNIVWITSEDNSKHYMKMFDPNGVETPNIESLASQGIKFTRAFSNAPVCSAARSTIISSCYGPRMGSNFHRRLQLVPLPEDVRMFPYYLKQAGYHTSNNAKEDYNFIKDEEAWDESDNKASWRNRKDGQPFFHVFNIATTHESRLHFTDMSKPTKNLPSDYEVQPNHPDTELFRYTNAYYRDKIQEMDAQVGEVLERLKADGLMDNTFIFYYGDHGGVLPGSKGYIYETGVHVPLVVYVPKKYGHLTVSPIGGEEDAFVEFVDLGPTVLNLAGVEVPKSVDGKPFMGQGITIKELDQRNMTFSYADRFDEKYDLVRAIRKGKYKYIRNYQPFNFDGLMNNYRYKQLAYVEWATLNEEHKLNETQAQFFKTRPAEMLFDVESDPFETKNLASDPNYLKTLKELRGLLNKQVCNMPDLSFYPEFVLIEQAFSNPVAFGQQHKKEIRKYISIADYATIDFAKAERWLKKSLASIDPWERYWALITCSAFGNDARSFKDIITAISKNDSEGINRVRAAEFLGLIKAEEPQEVMCQAIYDSTDPAEVLLMLNSVALMSSHLYGYRFELDGSKIKQEALADDQVVRRIEYFSAAK